MSNAPKHPKKVVEYEFSTREQLDRLRELWRRGAGYFVNVEYRGMVVLRLQLNVAVLLGGLLALFAFPVVLLVTVAGFLAKVRLSVVNK